MTKKRKEVNLLLMKCIFSMLPVSADGALRGRDANANLCTIFSLLRSAHDNRIAILL